MFRKFYVFTLLFVTTSQVVICTLNNRTAKNISTLRACAFGCESGASHPASFWGMAEFRAPPNLLGWQTVSPRDHRSCSSRLFVSAKKSSKTLGNNSLLKGFQNPFHFTPKDYVIDIDIKKIHVSGHLLKQPVSGSTDLFLL
jgi:hypothetical protein